MARAYTIRQFAGIAGVSVRTLHHYDRIGLPSPERSVSGYRTYHEHDLEVLEQIVALRFIGIPLKQIKTLLHRDPQEFVRALAAQRISLGEKRRAIDAGLHAIDQAERSVSAGRPVDAAALNNIIKVLTMQNNDAAAKYQALLDVKISRLREMSAERKADLGRRWAELFADVEKCLDDDPTGPRAQELAGRWVELLQLFSKGAAIDAALMQASAIQVRASAWSHRVCNPAVWDFIGKALSVRENRAR
jgi:MerR family transcriptional regulator, thiopeptide resistance regulator